jgi:hypothetical protein
LNLFFDKTALFLFQEKKEKEQLQFIFYQ